MSDSKKQQKLNGQRQLTEEEVMLINEVKSVGNALGDLLGKLKQRGGLDQRHISIGTTDIEKGFAMVIKGIARPTTFV